MVDNEACHTAVRSYLASVKDEDILGGSRTVLSVMHDSHENDEGRLGDLSRNSHNAVLP